MQANTRTDLIIEGEAELKFLEVLAGTRVRMDRVSLDGLEDPAFDLLDAKLYKPEFSHSGKIPRGCNALADFSISRGCPIGCTFCTSTKMWGTKIRAFSAERVRGQLRKLREQGFDHVSVEDDQVLMIPKDSLNAMIGELGKQGFGWDIDAGIYYPLIQRKQEFFSMAAANGCHRVFLPIEHPAIDLIHGEHKYKNLRTQEEIKKAIEAACEILRRKGIEFYVAIMVGFKQENEKTLKVVREYAKFVIEKGAAWVSFFYPKPLPGTVDYKNYSSVPKERGWEVAPEYWAFSTPVLKPDTMNLDELAHAVNSISLEVNGFENKLVNMQGEA
ncbi:radical SAM protein [Candidatus Micrarchaeota archaeon]|nr:radical SAM protein [Candidatus Micrarchaeota archaeon]